jgi:hypothetical protein
LASIAPHQERHEVLAKGLLRRKDHRQAFLKRKITFNSPKKRIFLLISREKTLTLSDIYTKPSPRHVSRNQESDQQAHAGRLHPVSL